MLFFKLQAWRERVVISGTQQTGGAVSPSAIYAETGSAFVLPSESENFANAALEAMAAGCPVVLSQHVGLADAVNASGAGLVCGDDTDSLDAALARRLDGYLEGP